MPFVLKADFADQIRDGYLDQITQFTDSKLDTASSKAVVLMQGYLNSRYDTVQIFATTGSTRDPVILMYAVDITLYYLHKLINHRKVPEFRKEAYHEAKEWLRAVSAEEINPVGLPLPQGLDAGEKDYILYGSNPKRVNYIPNIIPFNYPV